MATFTNGEPVKFFAQMAKDNNPSRRITALKLFRTEQKCRQDWFSNLLNHDDLADGWQAAFTAYHLSGEPESEEDWGKLQHRLCSHFKSAVSQSVELRRLSVDGGADILRTMAAPVNQNAADLARAWCARLLRKIRKDRKPKLAATLRQVWRGQVSAGRGTAGQMIRSQREYLKRASIACISS